MASYRASEETASPRELAEALWLAARISGTSAAQTGDPQRADSGIENAETGQNRPSPPQVRRPSEPSQAAENTPTFVEDAYRPSDDADQQRNADGTGRGKSIGTSALPLRLPLPREIRDSLAYLRSLRPLKALATTARGVLDEEATASRTAEARRLSPVYREGRERWLNLVLVLDSGPSMLLWGHLAGELKRLMERLGVFRTIEVRRLHQSTANTAAPDHRRAVLVISDCVGTHWRDGTAIQLLADWGHRGPVAIVNPLPRRLWNLTGIRTRERRLQAHTPMPPNMRLGVVPSEAATPIPILALDPAHFANWSSLLSGRTGHGVWADTIVPGPPPDETERSEGDTDTHLPVGAEAVAEFRANAAPAAFRLAGLLAAVKLNPPVMRAVQFIADAEFGSAHLAEVYLSGLLIRSDNEQPFDFAPGVRAALLATVRRSDTARLIERLDDWTQRNFEADTDALAAFVRFRSTEGAASSPLSTRTYVPYGNIPNEVLRRIGGRYAAAAAVRGPWIGRVVVLGEGGAGKTSTARGLVGLAFDATEPTTHGVAVYADSHPHPTKPDVEMTLDYWDLGGQEIYHATHQIYITPNSVIVLVWNGRSGWQQGRLQYWLDLIAARAPRSPVLLVGTHSGQAGHAELADLRRRYPQVCDELMVDNVTGAGLSQLRRCIIETAARLPMVGDGWPVAWHRAFRAVKALKEDFVLPSRLWRAMAEVGLRDEDQQRSVAQAMHDLCLIIYHPDDSVLNEFVALQPARVSQLLALVLDSQAVAESGGLLVRSVLAELWNDVDAGIRDYLIGLMERFALGYRVAERGEDVAFVVERLPWREPDFQEAWDGAASGDGAGDAEHEIRMIYALNAMPPGIPTWFIARSHRFSTGLHWRNGALLRHPDGVHRALVRADRQRNTVELAVRGPAPASFFAVLSDGLDVTIMQRYPGLRVDRLVPCQCGPDCSELYDFEDLQRRVNAAPPRLDIECRKSYETVYVPRLLLGLQPSGRDDMRGALDRLINTTDDLSDRLGEITANQQRMFLRLQQTLLGDRTATCPRVLAVTSEGNGGSSRTDADVYEVHLYCEEPGQWHRLAKNAGVYRLRDWPNWSQRIASYLRTQCNLLDAARAVNHNPRLPRESADRLMSADVMSMARLLDQLPAVVDAPPRTEQAQRAADVAEIRVIERLLADLDPAHNWGGLSRVTTPEGLTLYLCPEHARTYHL